MKFIRIFAFCFCFMGIAQAQSERPLEGSRISEQAKSRFTLSYFNHRPEVLKYFQERRLQGGGPTWGGIGKAGMSMAKSSRLSLIDFDAEGDALYASSSSKEALEELEQVLRHAASDVAYREECITAAKQRGEIE